MSVHIPDVLETVSQLAADDVYTSPKVANAMLDLLPKHVWTDQPDYKWLDPGAKSGVFLREVYRRLMEGLVKHIPDGQSRREHILKNMLFGAATTKLNGEIVRRTLYQSADATGSRIKDAELQEIAVTFDDDQGNTPFVETKHTLDPKGKACVVCRAPAKLIRADRENFAYSFIHNTYPPKEFANMQFDVIIGNPPYQIGMEDAEANKTANITPLYNLFVEKAISMNPRYIVMITPSRWFAGGKGLGPFRKRMIADRHLRAITDIPDAREVFPTVEVKGGVSYFLWDREWSGDCEFSSFQGGQIRASSKRDLRKYGDVIVRDLLGARIVDRVLENAAYKGGLDQIVSSQDPFGQSLKSNYRDFQVDPFPNAVPLIFNNKVGYVKLTQLERNLEWVNSWKVLLPKASDGTSRESASVLGEPIALAPGSACTQSYLVAGVFESREETRNYASFLTTKFCRFLVLQKKITQNMTGAMFSFVPQLDMTKSWPDSDLYKLFDLTPDEIEYIEKSVGPRVWIDSLDSPVPSTHLQGGRKYKVAVDETLDEDGDE